MAATGPQLSVSGSAWTAVTAISFCSSIRITENRGVSGFPNGDFLINKYPSGDKVGVSPPPSSPNTARIQGGAQYTFEAPTGFFSPGQIAGYIKMVAVVSTEFDQDEAQL
jgi:hypothetical protein